MTEVTLAQMEVLIKTAVKEVLDSIVSGKDSSAIDILSELSDECNTQAINMAANLLIAISTDALGDQCISERLRDLYEKHETREVLADLAVEIGAIDTIRSDESSGSMYIAFLDGLGKYGKVESVFNLAIITAHALSGYIAHMRECDGEDSE